MKRKMIMVGDNDDFQTWTPSNPDEISPALRSNQRQYVASKLNRLLSQSKRLKFWTRWEIIEVFHIDCAVPPDLRHGNPKTGWINALTLKEQQTIFTKLFTGRFKGIVPKTTEDPDKKDDEGKRKWIAPIAAVSALIYAIVAMSLAAGGS